MLEDVPPLVDLAALDDRRRPARLADRLAEARPAVDDEEDGRVEIESAIAEITQERLADRRVLGRALAEGEDVLLALQIHAQREQDDMVAEVEPVEDEHTDVEFVQRAGEPGGELRARERDEAARHATLRDGPLASPGGQGVERPAVLPRRDADRDRFQGARVERVTVRGVGEARQLELVAVDAARAQARHADAAATERHLAGRSAVAVRAAIGIADVLRSAQSFAILFHHRAQHLLARRETQTEEGGTGIGKDLEQRQGDLNGGDGWGGERFPDG
jgi:hypothetical protein